MGPEHTVKLADFRLDVTEVTVAAYRGCVNAGSCTEAGRKFNGPYQQGCMWDDAGLGTNPINCVTWPQADAYCKWAGKELPTEEQWEYAARGKIGRDFPWGMAIRGHDDWGVPDDVRDYVIGCDFGWRGACPVGSAPRGNTPEGVQDMAGNVREWTASVYCKYDNPRCGGEERVFRGGDIHGSGRHFRGTFRVGTNPEMSSDEIGFRCAQRVEEMKAP
jgi:formylglycine-generating enzyme required for sulfatase activity